MSACAVLLDQAFHLRALVGTTADEKSDWEAMRTFQVTRGLTRYWKQKVVDPFWKSGTWGGGGRATKFTSIDQMVIDALINEYIKQDPFLDSNRIAIKIVLPPHLALLCWFCCS